MSVRHDNTDVRVARNGVILPRDVLVEDDMPVSGRTADEQRAFRYRRKKPHINWKKEVLRILLALAGTLFAFIFLVACLGMAFVSYKMGGVLRDIGKRDFGDAMQRFERYGARFTALEDEGHRILSSKPKIVAGVSKYLWVVQPRGTDDRIVYRWKHDLNTNTVEPMTNPALLLDIALGYISSSDAAVYSFYDADDKLGQALAQGGALESPYARLGRMERGPLLQPTPVLPPLVDPQKGRKRTSPAAEEEEETAEEAAAAAAAEQAAADDTAANESTDVGGNQDRGGEEEEEETGDGDGGDSGDSSEVETGSGDEGEEEPAPEPPDSDAVPVE